MKRCEYCGKEIEQELEVCPFCKEKQGLEQSADAQIIPLKKKESQSELTSKSTGTIADKEEQKKSEKEQEGNVIEFKMEQREQNFKVHCYNFGSKLLKATRQYGLFFTDTLKQPTSKRKQDPLYTGIISFVLLAFFMALTVSRSIVLFISGLFSLVFAKTGVLSTGYSTSILAQSFPKFFFIFFGIILIFLIMIMTGYIVSTKVFNLKQNLWEYCNQFAALCSSALLISGLTVISSLLAKNASELTVLGIIVVIIVLVTAQVRLMFKSGELSLKPYVFYTVVLAQIVQNLLIYYILQGVMRGIISSYIGA